MSRHELFLTVYLVPIIFVLPIFASNYLFLRNTGELESLQSIVDIQQNTGALFGSAVGKNTYQYKMSLFEARRPKVIVLGSSTVLQFRQQHFTKPFTNMGQTMNGVREGVKSVKDFLSIGTPELVLIGLDFWWFNPTHTEPLNLIKHDKQINLLTTDALVAPIKWLREEKINLATYVDMINENRPIMDDPSPILGVQAFTDQTGYGPDGSYYYHGIVFGHRPFHDLHFSDTLSRVARNSKQFRWSLELAQDRLDTLFDLVRFLEQKGISVITYLPPIAPRVHAEMYGNAKHYSFVEELRKQLRSKLLNHFDFHDAASLGFTNCEFVDGFHSGDVLSGRMIDIMTRKLPLILGPYVDIKAVQSMITEFSGRALFDIRYKKEDDHEIDFLDLGCDKS